jgi:putative colanic acid biosynthesis acetyltransferase WcaF
MHSYNGTVKLALFNNRWYRPGRNKVIQIAWYFLGLSFLRSSLFPFSGPKRFVLRLFGAKVGTGVVIKPGVRVKYPWRLSIGDHAWIGEDAWIDNLADVEIENNVCVSQGVYFCTGNHDWSDPAFGLKIASIKLGSGCWIGARTVLLPGISVGAGGVAVAGSVVFTNIPDWEIHGGNPAVFRRRRIIHSPDDQKGFADLSHKGGNSYL